MPDNLTLYVPWFDELGNTGPCPVFLPKIFKINLIKLIIILQEKRIEDQVKGQHKETIILNVGHPIKSLLRFLFSVKGWGGRKSVVLIKNLRNMLEC